MDSPQEHCSALALCEAAAVAGGRGGVARVVAKVDTRVSGCAGMCWGVL